MKIPITFVTFLIILPLFFSFIKAIIVWELETLPSVFGKDVILKCTLPQNCCNNMQSRRWLGGNDLHLLTMNGFSIDPAKYSEKFMKENKTSILIIHDFDIMDINVPYECIYGSSTFVKMLNLTEDKFEYHPSIPYNENTTTNETNTLVVNFSTGNVYPRPTCSAAMNDEDISSYMTTTAILKGLFYIAIITVTIVLTPASCPGLLIINCRIGTFLYDYELNVTCNKIINDSFDGKVNPTMKDSVLVVILSVTGIVFVIAARVGLKNARRHCYPERSHMEEYALPHLDKQQRRKTGKRVK
ncbi:uncharacterized protein [Mytilus edulis]